MPPKPDARSRAAATPQRPHRTWPDIAGRLIDDGRAHVLPVRIYFEDTDFSGVAYHASHVRWCERGRSDFLRLLGQQHSALATGGDEREPAAFVVRRLSLDYTKPGRIDDLLEVTTRVRSITAATLVLDQRITRCEDTLCMAEVTVVLVTARGKILRLSSALRARLGKPAETDAKR